jgi:hypothetical protein
MVLSIGEHYQRLLEHFCPVHQHSSEFESGSGRAPSSLAPPDSSSEAEKDTEEIKVSI